MPDLTPEVLAPLLWAAMCEDAEARWPADELAPRWDGLGTWGEEGDIARYGMLAAARAAVDAHAALIAELAEARSALEAVRADSWAKVVAERDKLGAALADAERERDDLRTDYDAIAARWPRCPDGCGCLMDGEDADRAECGCDGPCTAECRENGYPDAPSYRDLAVSAERGRIKGLFGTWIDIIDPAGEPNSHPPEAWKIAFADLVSGKPGPFAREALEGGHG